MKDQKQKIIKFWEDYLNILSNQFKVDIYLISQSITIHSSNIYIKCCLNCQYNEGNAEDSFCQYANFPFQTTAISNINCIEHKIYFSLYCIRLPSELDCTILIKSKQDLSQTDINLDSYFDFLANNVFPDLIIKHHNQILDNGELSPFYNNLQYSSDYSITLIAKKILADPTKKYSLSTLSNEFHLSSNYISTRFKKIYGVSLKSFLNKNRILKAKSLLISSELSINQISHAVGYTDEAYFCKIFKKLTKTTPSDYRRKYRL